MEHKNRPLSEEWLNCLQKSGYRLTEPLRVIVNLLVTSSRALSPVELYDLGRQQYRRMGLVTIYRSLEKLTELGLVQRVHQQNGCHMYLRASNSHEHILLCTHCGRVEFFQGDDLSALIRKTESQSGFQVLEHWLQLMGVCQDCQGGAGE